jgi:cytochrome c oxidase subunit 3
MAWGVRSAQRGRRRLLVLCLTLTLAGGSGFLGIKYVEYRQKWREGLLWASRFNPKEPPPAVGPKAPPTPAQALGLYPEYPPDATPTAKKRAAGRPAVAAAPHEPVPKHVGLFFSIYFMMTGLHGIHVIAGMTAIGWILVRSLRGHFGPQYFGPVDYVGLYWHLVDLVWIYLFPLLYLIH